MAIQVHEGKTENGYLTVQELMDTGWTRGLIDRFLGPPNRLLPVNHFRNFHGKKAWRIEWIESMMMTQGFETGYLRSAKSRRLPVTQVEQMIDLIYTLREEAPMKVEVLESEEQRKLNACFYDIAELFSEARRRGYRTPHKC